MPNLSKRTVKFTNIVLQLIVFATIYFGIQYYNKIDIKRGAVPPLVGRTLDNQSFTLQQLHGKPFLIHFWATWCHVCSLEKNSIDALSKDYAVITVASQSGSSLKLSNYMIENDLSFRVVVDENGFIAKAFGVGAFPTSIFVNERGEIKFIEVGFTTELGLRARLKML